MSAAIAATDAHEGPVYVAAENALYFTSVPRPQVDIRRLDLATGRESVLVPDANAANGMALAPDGRLIVCEQGGHERAARISLVDRANGRAETVVDSWDGRPLNSPNDVAVAPDGAIWFTDPGYGYLQGFRPPPMLGDVVYRHDPRSGETTVVASGFDKPNGLAFAPDGATLYVGDSGDSRRHVEAFDVVGGVRLTRRRAFAAIDPGHPDGIKVDAAGRVLVASESGIGVYAPDGERLTAIALPGAVNLALGPGGVLFVTADTAVWSAVVPTLQEV